MKYFLSQFNSRVHVISGIYIRQYVNFVIEGTDENGENW